MHVLRLWTILERSAVSNNQSNTLWLCDGSLQHWQKFNTCSIVSNVYLFYVSFAGLGISLGLESAGIDLGLSLCTAGLGLGFIVLYKSSSSSSSSSHHGNKSGQ